MTDARKEKRMLRVLFVDDDHRVLDGLRRALYSKSKDWDMHFVARPSEGLKLIERSTKDQLFDLVVSDLRMPESNGEDFLSEVRALSPQTARFVLSGQAKQERFIGCMGFAHQYLTKPIASENLISKIEKTFAIRKRLRSPELEKLVASTDSLPSIPVLYQQILNEISSSDSSSQSVSRLIEKDVALSAKLLQLVNSGFFALSKPVKDLTQAVTLVGLDAVEGILLHHHLFTVWKPDLNPLFDMETYWVHSLRTALMAREMAKQLSFSAHQRSFCFIGGLLHDVGRLLIASRHPVAFKKIQEMTKDGSLSSLEAEKEILGSDHSEIGAGLCNLWGFPDDITEACLFHHRPLECPSRDCLPLTVIHVADRFAHEINGVEVSKTRVSAEYITSLGLMDFVLFSRDALITENRWSAKALKAA